MQIILISVAGMAGVLGRHFINLALPRALGGLPYKAVAVTMFINVVGSFLAGLVAVLASERAAISEPTRIAIMVGFLGGFTTFSAFALETARLAEGGLIGLAAANVLGSVVLGTLAVGLGMYLGRVF